MSLKRYTAYKDTTITNAFDFTLTNRGTGSNMGLADSLEVFSIYGQASSSSLEASRVLVQFPVSSSDTGTTILADRTAGTIPASGSVNFYLRVFNVAHGQTLPRDFTLVVAPVSQSWEEGYGLDMDEYKDKTYDGTGSNWINARANTAWTNQGGDYLTASAYSEFNYTQTFDKGTEDLEIDVTGLVEQWIKGAAGGGYENYGFGIFLTGSQESGNRSYYTKKFSARGSEYFFSRPIIEARWDSTKKDQRGSFYASSSVASAADNLNTIYLYNYVRGQLKDLPGAGTGNIYVEVYDQSSAGTQLTTTPEQPVTGGWVETGVYSASFALDPGTNEVVYDRWFSGSIVYHTGSITPKTFTANNAVLSTEYCTTITNLKPEYYKNEVSTLRLFTRPKKWNPTIYTVATTAIENTVIDDIYYRVFRNVDEREVISYGTGSLNHTRLSYDVSGSYFDLDFSMFEPNYEYAIKFLFYIDGSYRECDEVFQFKVVE